MTRLEVDTADLYELGESVRNAALEAEAVTMDRRDLLRTASALRDPQLIAAVAMFVDAWNDGLEELVDDAYRLADAITLLSGIYEDTEVAIRSGVLDEALTPVLGPNP